jgi:hypothetical protein
MNCKFCKRQSENNIFNLCGFHHQCYQTELIVLNHYKDVLEGIKMNLEKGKISFDIWEEDIKYYELKLTNILETISKYEN